MTVLLGYFLPNFNLSIIKKIDGTTELYKKAPNGNVGY